MLVGTVASAVPCTNAGATLNSIDGSAYGPVNASACETFLGNVGSGSTFINGLNDGTFFGGMFDPGTTWVTAGKDETSGDNGADVEATVGQKVGTWTADFGSDVLNTIVVALKGGKGGSKLFLFKDLVTAGSVFGGGYDMQKAGLVNNKGKGQNLSNLSVAGVFIKCDPQNPDCGDGGTGGTVPLPAGLPLLLTALGLGGFAARRAKKKSA